VEDIRRPHVAARIGRAVVVQIAIAPAHERVGEAGDAEVAQLGLQAAAEEAGLGAGRHVEQAVEAVAVRVQRAHARSPWRWCGRCGRW
jgi:hypothetical protein